MLCETGKVGWMPHSERFLCKVFINTLNTNNKYEILGASLESN